MARKTGYRIYRSRSDSGYQHLHLELLFGDLEDAAKVYAKSGTEYDLETLKELREKTGSTLYLHTTCCGEDRAELRWQSHRRSHDDPEVRNGTTDAGTWSEWYALKIDSASFSQRTLSELQKIVRRLEKDHEWIHDASPAMVVTTLKNLGAVAVNYSSRVNAGVGRWYFDDDDPDRYVDAAYEETVTA